MFGLVDNLAPEDTHAAVWCDDFERRRDLSHLRCLPASEWAELIEAAGLELVGFVRRRMDAAEAEILADRYEAGASDRGVEDLLRDDGTVPFPDVEANRGDYDILSWDMEPGDCVAFNARIIHGGSGNLSEGRDLKVFNTQWLGDDVRVCFREEGMDPDHSTIMTEHGLKPGDRPGTALYPQVWARA